MILKSFVLTLIIGSIVASVGKYIDDPQCYTKVNRILDFMSFLIKTK